MKGDLIFAIAISVFLLIMVFLIMKIKYKKLKKMNDTERKTEINKNLNKAGWLTIVKNILRFFTD